MKTLFLTILTCLTISTYSQNTKQQDIALLVELIEIQSSMNDIVEQGIVYYQKQKPFVPEHIWSEIKANVNYSPYLQKVLQIFDSNYSQIEIKDLIVQAKETPKKIPLFKKIVQQKLYEAGKQFGRSYADYIKETLARNGY
jgi:hypothetical protein